MNFYEALEASGLAEKHKVSKRDEWGLISEEVIKIIIRVCALENCPRSLLAHAWDEESTLRLYPECNHNDKDNPENKKNPIKWDFGGLQINREKYIANVERKYFKGLPEDEVFGRTFFNPDGTPSVFTGNPFINAQAGARHLMRIDTKGWQEKGFTSPEAMRAGIYTGGHRVQKRAESYVIWRIYWEDLFNLYEQKMP